MATTPEREPQGSQQQDIGETMNTTTTNQAYDYALLIRRELVALETVAEVWLEIANYPEQFEDDYRDEITQALTELEWEWPTDSDMDPIMEYLDNVLEIQILRGNNDRARIEILRTCGGPRCDITRDTNDGTVIEISVHDGSDHSVIRVNLPTVANYLDMLGE
jgi:hypothetical protein